MVPVCFPSKISSTTGLREAVVYALSSVTGLVRWTDYIPVKLVASADAALEGRTDAGGFIPMDMLSSSTGLMGWVDYLPVYIDNSATDAWAITATGFIPYAASGGFVSTGPAVSSITSATQTEGTSLVHTVTLASAVTGVPATYTFSISGTASVTSDYTLPPTFSNSVTLLGGILTVPVAVTTFTITVATSQDTVYEGTETYTISVGGMSNTGTINDDESAPTITSVSGVSAAEGSDLVHTVAITGTAQAARSYAITLVGVTATGGGVDFTSTLSNGMFSNGVTVSGGNISVPAGVTGFTVTIPTVDDAVTESTETYTLTIGGASGTGTITDNDAAAPTVSSVSTATQTEGISLVHTVTLSAAVSGVSAVYPFSISAVTASTPSDYTATPTFSNSVTLSGNTLTVPVGVTSFTVTVATTQDTIYEGAETYSVSVGGVSATGTINDDESAPTITSVSSASATEAANIVHTVTVTGTAQAAQSYALTLSGGTATGGGTDYTSSLTNAAFSNGVTISGGTITVPAGVTSFTVSVPTSSDALVEGSETYTLSIGGASGTGTIIDEDAPAVAFSLVLSNPVGATISDGTGTATVTGGAGPSDLVTVMSTALSGGTVTGTGGITTATTGIASRTTGVAPMGVFFDATGTTNSLGIDNFHDILYLWNFGDSETAWTYGTGVGDNSKNRARGGVAAHVYETAGTYTAKVTPVTVSSLGVLSYGTTTSISITVNSAARSGTTYIVSSSGVFTGAPAGTQVTTSDIATALGSGRLAANTRFLFKGGETFNSASSVNVNVSGVTFGAWGTGKPIITQTSVTSVFSMPVGVGDIIAMDLSLDATSTAAGRLFGTSGASHSNLTMLRVDTNKNGDLIDIGFTDGVFVVDCNGQNFVGGTSHVGVYVEHSSRVAILGCRVYDASAIEHCLRMQGSERIVISNNTLALPANNKHVVTIRGRSNQPSGDKTTWSGVYGEKVIISDNSMLSRNGATWTVQFAPQDTGDNGPVRTIVCERNFIDNGDSPADVFSTEAVSGVTIRNNLIKCDGNYDVFMVIYRNAYVAEAPTSTYIYNNTVYRGTAASPTYVNAMVLLKDSGTASGAIPTGTVYRNNLVTGPTLSNAVLVSTDCGATASIATSSTEAQMYGTSAGITIPPTSTFTTWKATSGYSINGGSYAPVFDDFFGAARTGTYDMGAVNP